MSIELKIKSKHLAEESRIIRFEENKLKSQVRYQSNKHRETGSNSEFEFFQCKEHQKRESLYLHRTRDVRFENRATFLARAYLAGKSYHQVENKREESKECEFYTFVLPRVIGMVKKYGKLKDDSLEEKIKSWATLK